eukprot:534840_1
MNRYENWLQCPPKDPNRILRTSDIWQRPRKHLNKPNFNLNVSDIEGARPRPEKSNLGNRIVNPLNPQYEWSKINMSKPLNCHAKFMRDTLDISDIWGTKPSKNITYSCKQRDNMNYRDIERSYAGWKGKYRKKKIQKRDKYKFDKLSVSDINNDFTGVNRFKTTRCTNPLQPQYKYNNSKRSGLLKLNNNNNNNNNNNKENINILGNIKGSSSSFMNKYTNRNGNEFNLRTNDILGA